MAWNCFAVNGLWNYCKLKLLNFIAIGFDFKISKFGKLEILKSFGLDLQYMEILGKVVIL